MSELRTNRIVPRDGLPSGSSGGIIQVKQSVLTSSAYQNINAGANYDWSNLTCTITPTRSDSKILIQCVMYMSSSNDSGRFGYRVMRIPVGGSAAHITPTQYGAVSYTHLTLPTIYSV